MDVNDSVRPLDCDDLATPAPFAEIPPPLGSVHDECFFKDIIDIEPVQTNATNIFEHFEFVLCLCIFSEGFASESWRFSELVVMRASNLKVNRIPNRLFFDWHLKNLCRI